MTDINNQKVGHRNYAVVDVENLTAEELEAVKESKLFHGLCGTVPFTYKVNGKLDIFHHWVFKNNGYTVVMDEEKSIRFIHKGYLTLDEVSLMNRGNTVERLRGWYQKLIFEEKQNENPWNLE